MTIINDVLTFETTDFQLLSPALQAAVIFRAGVQVPAEYLSVRFNAVLEESLALEKKSILDAEANQDVSVAFARSNVTTQNQIKLILGIAAV